MKRKNIIISFALILLVVLAGCEQGAAYPHFPQSAVITQTQQFIEGQAFDASGFSVTVTYLDGSVQKYDGGALIYTDNGVSGMSYDDRISVNVGKDINAKDVEAAITPSVINVNRIEVSLADGVDLSYTEKTESQTTSYVFSGLDKSDVIVTAVASDGQTYVLGESAYANPVVVDSEKMSDIISALGEEAKTVDITVSVSIPDSDGASRFTATVPATASIIREPEVLVDVVEMKSITISGTPEIYALDYTGEELPTITDVKNFAINAALSNGTTRNLTDEEEASLLADGLVVTLINQSTGEALKDSYGEYDLRDFVSGSNLGFAAEYDGVTVKTSTGTNSTAVQLKVEYFGDTLYIVGEALPAIDTDDYRVTLVDNAENTTETYEVLHLSAENFAYYSAGNVYTGTTVPEKDKGLSVNVSYFGLKNGPDLTAYVDTPDTTTITGITVTLKGDAVGPAKQIHTTAPVFDVDNIESVTITTKTGDKEAVTAEVPAPYTGFTFEYSTSNNGFAPLEDGQDLSSTDVLYVWTTVEGSETAVAAPTIKTTAAVATGLSATAEYDSAIGSKINWTIATVNDEGVVQWIYKDGNGTGYTIWKNGVTTGVTLPTEVTGEAQGPYVFTYNGFSTEADPITIAAGDGYIIPAEDGFTVEIKSSTDTRIDQPISTLSSDYEVKAGTWTKKGECAAPEVYSIRLQVADQKYEASTTVYARVQYIDINGETVISDEIPVTITGTPYTEPAETGFAITYGDNQYSNGAVDFPLSGSVSFSDFTVYDDSFENHGTVSSQPTITEIRYSVGGYDYVVNKSSQPFGLNSAGITMEIDISYVDGLSEENVTATIEVTTGTV